MNNRILSMDIGESSVGLAVSDPTGTFAIPIGTIKRGSKKEDAEKIKKIMEERNVDTLAAGMPLDMEGNRSKQASVVMTFVKFLYKETGMKTEFVDERYTTKMANDTLKFLNVKRGKQKGAEDALAASYILEIYLKKHNS